MEVQQQQQQQQPATSQLQLQQQSGWPQQAGMPGAISPGFTGGQAPQYGMGSMDDRSTASKAASNMNKSIGRVSDRSKVMYVKATGDGIQKVRHHAAAMLLSAP